MTDGRIVTIDADEVTIYDPATGKTTVCFRREKFYGERGGPLRSEIPNAVLK